MPASRDEILTYLADHLNTDAWRDYAPIGLQVQGKEEVRKIVTGVSANLAFFEKAVDAGADMLLVHHGMFWKNESSVIQGPLRERIRFLLEHDLTLAAYHLPLDAHAEHGNNALALRELGATDLAPWGEADGQAIGWRGRFPDPVPAKDLFAQLEAYYAREPLVFPYGPDDVSTIALVSGGGQSFARQALAEGDIDCFVTGEVSEWVMSAVKEGGMHFVSAGHYATEVVGIRALGEHVAERFDVEHAFVDVPNPV